MQYKIVCVLSCAILLSLAVNVSAAGLSDTTDDGTGTISARGENLPNEGAAKAFDNNTATKWLDFSPTYSWIQYQYAADKRPVVTEYTLTSANDYNERDPNNWNILGSNDNGASWVTLDTRAGELFTSRFQKRSFLFTNSTGYNIYRLEITKVRSGIANSVQLAEIELIGTTPELPAKAISPSPANIATGVSITATLSWTVGSGAASHDIYFGTAFSDVNSAERLLGDLNGDGWVDYNDLLILADCWLQNPTSLEPYAGISGDNIVDFFDYALLSQNWMNRANPVFKGNHDANSFNPGLLAFNTTYYWRVDEVNGPNMVKGDVWSFTTQSGKAFNPSPASGATGVVVNPTLSWSAGYGATSHNVYFGTTNPPASIGNQTAVTYNPSTLANSTVYYWRIDEVGGSGTVTGDLWSFTTAANGPEFTFVQASDPQMGWTQCGNSDYLWGTTISKINTIDPDFLIVTGDLVNTSSSDSQATTYLNYAASLNPAIERYQLPGNHDIGDTPKSSNYSWFQSKFGFIPSNPMPWYSFTYGDSIFICLDSCILRNPGGSGLSGKDTEEINWLTTTLQGASGYTHKFVFMHHPLFVNDPNEAYDSRYNFQMPRRTELLNIFHTYSVNTVFAGHLHFNAYGRDGNLEMISTSSCTCGLGTPPTTPGVRVIKVYSDHIEQEYRTLDSIP
ncbi:MAG: metallophosphoesterase [Sedimentisphaerales bacterium]